MGENGDILATMKTINRMAMGTIASLLLSAGLARTAQKLDPLSNSLSNSDCGRNSNEASANACVLPCFYQSE
jgi:hypothetical protein